MATNQQFQLFRSNIERFGEQFYRRGDDVVTLVYSDCDYNLFLPMTLDGSQVLFWTGETTSDESKVFTVDPVEMISHDTWDWKQYAAANDGQPPVPGIHLRYRADLDCLWPDVNGYIPWGSKVSAKILTTEFGGWVVIEGKWFRPYSDDQHAAAVTWWNDLLQQQTYSSGPMPPASNVAASSSDGQPTATRSASPATTMAQQALAEAQVHEAARRSRTPRCGRLSLRLPSTASPAPPPCSGRPARGSPRFPSRLLAVPFPSPSPPPSLAPPPVSW